MDKHRNKNENDLETNHVKLLSARTLKEQEVKVYGRKDSGVSAHANDGKSTAKDRRKKGTSSLSTFCYRMGDLVVNTILIFPLVIGFWRGVWQLMDYHSVRWEIDPWLSLGTGYAIPFVLYLFQEPLKKYVHPSKLNFVLYYIVSRFLLLLHSFGSVNQWRGLWVLLDIQTGAGVDGGIYAVYSAVSSVVIGIVGSILFKSLINVSGPPLFVYVDDVPSVHDCSLRFKTNVENRLAYFWDCVFSVGVVSSFVVLSWRGLWNIADIFLYPDDADMSAMVSLVFGYGLCLIITLAQPLISRLVGNLKGFSRLVIVDTVNVLGFVGCVFAWRGLWNSYNLYLTFETETLSEWVTTIAGSLGTVIFGCVASVVVRGVAIDGEDNSDWTISYVSLLSTPVYDVPFPEPWICRLICTSQKMNVGKQTKTKLPNADGAKTPLNKLNVLTNSVHPENQMWKNRQDQISTLRNIDSSSEEDLGMRATMLPSAEDDSVFIP